jgi:hypothetical protein
LSAAKLAYDPVTNLWLMISTKFRLMLLLRSAKRKNASAVAEVTAGKAPASELQ